MTASDLVDKAHENGIGNIPFLMLENNVDEITVKFKDMFFQDDKPNQDSKKIEKNGDSPRCLFSDDEIIHSINDTLAAFDNVPFLADFLTISTSVGGVGGVLNNQINMNNDNNIHNSNISLNTSNNTPINSNLQFDNLFSEMNAVNNLGVFQYDDMLLNFSTTDTENSSVSNISSKNGSQNPMTELTIPYSTTRHINQNNETGSNRNNTGLDKTRQTRQNSTLFDENQESKKWK